MPELNLDSLFTARPPEPLVPAAPATDQASPPDSFEDHLQRAGGQGAPSAAANNSPSASAANTAPPRAESSPPQAQSPPREANRSDSADGDPADDQTPVAEDAASGKQDEEATRQTDSGEVAEKKAADGDPTDAADSADENADSLEMTVAETLAAAADATDAVKQAAAGASAKKERKERSVETPRDVPAEDVVVSRGRGKAKPAAAPKDAAGKNGVQTDVKPQAEQPVQQDPTAMTVDADSDPQDAVPGAKDADAVAAAKVEAAKPGVPIQTVAAPMANAVPAVAAVASDGQFTDAVVAGIAPDEERPEGSRSRPERSTAARTAKSERAGKETADLQATAKAPAEVATPAQKPGSLTGAAAATRALEVVAADSPSRKDTPEADATIKDPAAKPPAAAPHARGEEPSRPLATLDAAGPHSASKPSGASEVERVRFIQRVARAFQTASQRDGSVRLRLSPPELGSLRLEVTVRGGVMTARLEAEHPAARTMLLDNLPALRDRLAEQNIKIARFDVDLMGQSPGGLPERRSEDTGPERFARSPAAAGKLRRQEEAPVAPALRRGGRAGEGGAQLNIIV